MFKNLCGTESYKNVVVLTTFWDLVSKELGQKREAQLKSQFFQDLVNGGACFMRHNRTVEQAHKVLKHFFTLDPTYVKLADELGRQKMPFEETAAGSVQREEVERMIAEHRQEVEQLQAEMRAMKDDNEAIKRELEVERAEMQKKLVKWETELEELRGGLDKERNAREQLENDAKLRTDNSEWKAVRWPVGDISWKATDDASRLLISRYKLYTNNGLLWDYKLEFTNTGGSDFDFMDEAGDVYNVFAILDGDHYVRYNSEKPTIVAVRVKVSVASKHVRHIADPFLTAVSIYYAWDVFGTIQISPPSPIPHFPSFHAYGIHF